MRFTVCGFGVVVCVCSLGVRFTVGGFDVCVCVQFGCAVFSLYEGGSV